MSKKSKTKNFESTVKDFVDFIDNLGNLIHNSSTDDIEQKVIQIQAGNPPSTFTISISMDENMADKFNQILSEEFDKRSNIDDLTVQNRTIH